MSGKLVYNQTFACGSPSYLYSCPPTNQAAPDGLNGAYLVRGTLLFGGGPWSQQNYFMAALPALAEEEEEEAGEEAATGGGNGGIAGSDGDVPVLTFVNASSAQGSWLASGSASLFVAGAAPGGWPLKVQFVPGGGGTCARPAYSSQMVSTRISADGWSVVSTPFGSGDGAQPGCPFRQAEISGWWASAACAGASFGFPDSLV
jgi:hypothetical protein